MQRQQTASGRISKTLLAATVFVMGCSVAPGIRSPMERYAQLKDASFLEENPRSICEVHKIETILCEVLVVDGMCVKPDKRYLAQLLRVFPNSYWEVNSCSCVSFGDLFVLRSVCPACRDAERRWRVSRGWSIDSEGRCFEGLRGLPLSFSNLELRRSSIRDL